MGITGLLPFLKAIQRDIHLSSFRGKKAAVDSYCWLHKGAYSCALQLVMGTANLETLPFIRYCMKRVHLLRQYDITPIMVFDGGHLPTKSNTEKERRERRRGYLDKGKQLLKDGKKSEANDCFQKCVDVSPEMALALIKACRKVGVECVVAPYEADAQLTYLQNEGIVDFVITEDSDLLVFGCERVFFKMDDSGNGKLIELSDLGKANKGLVGFTQDSFRQMCIFSGCDYLSSVPGIGLGKSLKLMRKCNQNPTRVIKTLQFETGKVPKNYEEDFQKAEHTFLYQLVFDPRSQKQVRLHQLPDDVDPNDVDFAGAEHSPKKAVHMARGNIDPITLRVLDSYSPSKAPPPKSTSWEASAMSSSSKNYPLSIQAKLPLVSTEKSRQPFRAPKRKFVEEAGTMGEEELCSMYMESSQSDQTNYRDEGSTGSFLSARRSANPIIKSKFFTASPPQTQSSLPECSEQTPSESDLFQELSNPARRILSTGDTDQTSNPTESSVETARTCDRNSNESPSVKKQLFGHAHNRESVKKLRGKFAFSSTKRQRRDSTDNRMACTNESDPGLGNKHPFELLEQSSPGIAKAIPECSDSSPSRNPFSVTRQSPKTSPSFRVVREESIKMDDTELAQSTNSQNSEDYTTHDRDRKMDTSQYMSSSDFITPHSSLRLNTMSSTDDPQQDVTMSSDIGYSSSQKDKSDEMIVSQSSSMDVGQSGSSHVGGTWFSKKRASVTLSKTAKSNRRNVGSVGLAKSSAGSKFRAPRSMESDSSQTSLSSFVYTRRPKMKL